MRAIYDVLRQHFGPRNWWPGESRLEVVVGAILTQNTAWTNVERAIKNLKAQGMLEAPKAICKTGNRELGRLIRPSGYYNQKSERLKLFMEHIVDKYGGDLDVFLLSPGPTKELRKELLDLKGIGPETADSILLYAAERPIFVIDAYTKRIMSRVLDTKKAEKITNSYHELQQYFMSNLPLDTELFNDYHAQLVELGKNFCRKKPMCEGTNVCPLAVKGLCFDYLDKKQDYSGEPNK